MAQFIDIAMERLRASVEEPTCRIDKLNQLAEKYGFRIYQQQQAAPAYDNDDFIFSNDGKFLCRRHDQPILFFETFECLVESVETFYRARDKYAEILPTNIKFCGKFDKHYFLAYDFEGSTNAPTHSLTSSQVEKLYRTRVLQDFPNLVKRVELYRRPDGIAVVASLRHRFKNNNNKKN
jgi:hypothetical protein